MTSPSSPKSLAAQYPVAALAPLVTFPAIVFLFSPRLPAWIFMWLLALSIFFACKWLSLLDAWKVREKISKARGLAFFFLWPGMDPSAFLFTPSTADKTLPSQWITASAKTALGAFFFWILPRWLGPTDPLLQGWMGMLGLIFLLHFGTFDLMALFWRSRGVPVEPLMYSPLRARSLSDFWGKRWNRDFRRLGYRFIFQPLSPIIGTALAGFAVFLASGLVHDLVISVPARGGYGLPTAYFVIQGLGVMSQRSALWKRWDLSGGVRGWLMMAFFTAGPAYFLFHPLFVRNVMVPMMKDLGALPI